MNNKSSNYEEDVNREFLEAEGNIVSDQATEKMTSLGKVDMTRGTGMTSPDDPEIKRIQELAGHIKLDLTLLPSGGKFYRDDFEIHIRAARVGEIRDFSTVNEENLKDVDDKLNSILVSCTKIMYGPQKGSYRDILEEDRIYIILAIRELTFKNGEAKIMMPVGKKKCTTASCKSQDSMELRTNNLQFNHVDDLVERYYDSVNKCYTIQTKNHGEFSLAPPTIGVMRAITDYVRKREEENKTWDKSSIAILPYMQREWRGFNEREIFAAMTAFQGWDTGKYSIIYRLVEKMKVGIKAEFIYPCQSCGAEVTVPLSFPGGIRSLFIIQDITSELL
jgi:hypothetical protein